MKLPGKSFILWAAVIALVVGIWVAPWVATKLSGTAAAPAGK